jgi:hypothetical protein
VLDTLTAPYLSSAEQGTADTTGTDRAHYILGLTRRDGHPCVHWRRGSPHAGVIDQDGSTASHPGMAKVVFTGSTAVGKKMAEAAARLV